MADELRGEMELEEFRDYLDEAIAKWREIANKGGKKAKRATYYIDAFQSVRTSMFGEVLPAEEVEPDPEREVEDPEPEPVEELEDEREETPPPPSGLLSTTPATGVRPTWDLRPKLPNPLRI